jgi:hypothetical protein
MSDYDATTAAWAAQRQHMASLFLSGKTLAEIGAVYGITHQAVSLRLKREGITADMGGARKQAEERLKETTAALFQTREAARLIKLKHQYGVASIAEYEALSRRGLLFAFKVQKRAAARRGIGWELSFQEWLGIWEASGKLGQRGRCRGQWVMGRNGDVGPYAVGNVFIITHADNTRMAARTVKPAELRVVRRTDRNAWVVKRGSEHHGYFKSYGAAVEAKTYIKKLLTGNC